MVQWLGLHAFRAEGLGSVPGWGAKISQAVWCSPNKQTEKNRQSTKVSYFFLRLIGQDCTEKNHRKEKLRNGLRQCLLLLCVMNEYVNNKEDINVN